MSSDITEKMQQHHWHHYWNSSYLCLVHCPFVYNIPLTVFFHHEGPPKLSTMDVYCADDESRRCQNRTKCHSFTSQTAAAMEIITLRELPRMKTSMMHNSFWVPLAICIKLEFTCSRLISANRNSLCEGSIGHCDCLLLKAKDTV